MHTVQCVRQTQVSSAETCKQVTHNHDAIEVGEGAREEVSRDPQAMWKDEAMDSTQQLSSTPRTYTRVYSAQITPRTYTRAHSAQNTPRTYTRAHSAQNTPRTYTRAHSAQITGTGRTTHYPTTAEMSLTCSHDNQLNQEQVVKVLVHGNVVKHKICPHTWTQTAGKNWGGVKRECLCAALG